MLTLIKAFIIMLKAHKSQKDKGGRAYIFHPINVMLGVKSFDCKIVALLHDVIEDSNYSIDDMKFLSKKQKEALLLLTHNDEEPYFLYIEKIKSNEIAKEVKMSDLKQNSDISRIKNITNKDISRRDKYIKAINILSN